MSGKTPLNQEIVRKHQEIVRKHQNRKQFGHPQYWIQNWFWKGKTLYFFSITLQMFTRSYRRTLPSLQGNFAIFTGESVNVLWKLLQEIMKIDQLHTNLPIR